MGTMGDMGGLFYILHRKPNYIYMRDIYRIYTIHYYACNNMVRYRGG